MNDEYVYFELNDWMPNDDYPNEEPYISLCTGERYDKDGKFYWQEPLLRQDDWVKKNELSVVSSNVDMSMNFCVVAKRDWVEKNCPSLLTEYKKFLRFEGEGGNTPFWPIDSPEDYGVHPYDWWDNEWVHENEG